MIPKETKSEIIRYSQRMDQKGWVANHDGNITLRLQTGGFAATPSGRPKFDLSEDEILELDAAGKRQAGGSGSAFSEFSVHQKIFKARSDIHAVVHAHPPRATAVGCANQEMLTSPIPEAVVSLGPGVPLVGLALPNSDALWSEMDLLLKYYDAILVGGNGVFTWGKTLEQAFLRMELVEHLAEIFISTLPLGGPRMLSTADILALLKKRADAGLALPPDPSRPHWFPAANK